MQGMNKRMKSFTVFTAHIIRSWQRIQRKRYQTQVILSRRTAFGFGKNNAQIRRAGQIIQSITMRGGKQDGEARFNRRSGARSLLEER